MISFSDTLRSQRAQLLATAIDQGSLGAASLCLYGGNRPGSGQPVTDQPLLISLLLAYPCAASVGGGVLVLKPIPETLVTADGTLSWGRLLDRDGLPVADLEVGLPGSGADIELPALAVYRGAFIRIDQATLTEP